MMKMTTTVCSMLLALAAIPANAHDDAYFDSHVSPHGGQTRMSGPFHFELVVAPQNLQVYITDHAGTPQAVDKLTGRATVLSGGKRTDVDLHPGDTAQLVGDAQLSLQPDTLIVLSVHTPEGEVLQARFTPGLLHQHDAASHMPSMP